MDKDSRPAQAKPRPSGDAIDDLVGKAVFAADSQQREECRRTIQGLASAQGIFPASIQSLYEAVGKGLYSGMTVPAINIRGLTYQVARAVFQAALKHKVGALIFEIARSEIDYTKQRPGEYATCILAAAVREGFKGPVFLQGDHFQVNLSKFNLEPEKEMDALKDLIAESMSAGFLNIDIDASTLVNLEERSLNKQQEKNCWATAYLTKFIRSTGPKLGGATISVGGEIGEVGKTNSTVGDLRAFMAGYLALLGPDLKGISKISVQTGTTHGGVVLPDGSVAKMELDFKVLSELSQVARQEYGLCGAVQHGASTLPDEAFELFPRAGTAEVHLATGFQNIIYDSPFFPRKLLGEINSRLSDKYSNEKKPGETVEQFLYKTRKKGFGDFKQELWGLPKENLEGIREALEKRFELLFQKLNVVGTADLVEKFVTKSPPGR